MIRDLVHLGPLTLRPYGMMLCLAFVVGLWFAWRRARRAGLPTGAILDLSQVILVSSIAGARFHYVASHWASYADSPWRIFALWEGGLTFFGGGILATLASVWWIRRRGLPVLFVADVVAPSVALGAAFTRVGCFLNGCCFGKPTDLFWGVRFPPGSFSHQVLGDVPLHPTQLLQSVWAVGVFLLLWRLGLKHRPGTVFWSLILLLPLGRAWIDYFRYHGPDARVQVVGIWLPVSFIIAVGLVVLGIIGLAALRGRPVARG